MAFCKIYVSLVELWKDLWQKRAAYQHGHRQELRSLGRWGTEKGSRVPRAREPLSSPEVVAQASPQGGREDALRLLHGHCIAQRSCRDRKRSSSLLRNYFSLFQPHHHAQVIKIINVFTFCCFHSLGLTCYTLSPDVKHKRPFHSY